MRAAAAALLATLPVHTSAWSAIPNGFHGTVVARAQRIDGEEPTAAAAADPPVAHEEVGASDGRAERGGRARPALDDSDPGAGASGASGGAGGISPLDLLHVDAPTAAEATLAGLAAPGGQGGAGRVGLDELIRKGSERVTGFSKQSFVDSFHLKNLEERTFVDADRDLDQVTSGAPRACTLLSGRSRAGAGAGEGGQE